MIAPAYLEAVRGGLAGTALGVYLRLYHDHLDAWEYRPIKQLALAHEMRCSLRTVEAGIATCLRLGYIERAAKVVGEPRSYRLVHRRLVAATLDSRT